jgi:hypothetical protein
VACSSATNFAESQRAPKPAEAGLEVKSVISWPGQRKITLRGLVKNER